MPDRRPDHAETLAAFALDMRDTAARFGATGEAVPLRIGIACGPVVAGVVGSKRFFFDVWGDTVNLAARMEATGEPGRIQVSAEARARLKEKFILEPRGTVDVKGKGPLEIWFLAGRRVASPIAPVAVAEAG